MVASGYLHKYEARRKAPGERRSPAFPIRFFGRKVRLSAGLRPRERAGARCMENQKAAELAERVRPLVNEILERFNQEGVNAEEAGMVVLALTHRLMTVLEGNPEEQRSFIVSVVNLINRYLAGDFRTD